MLKGLYTAAAGMLAVTTANDILASNLANVNTIAFKGSKVNFQTFPDMLMNRINNQSQQPVGSLTTGSQVFESYNSFAPGAIMQTGNPFDLAIQGDGFLTVKNNAGQSYYTRAGNLTINEQGFLTTVDGALVQGKLGNIQLSQDGGPFSVNTQGSIIGRTGVIDQLQIARFENNHLLSKVSDNLYETTPAVRKLPDLPSGAALPCTINSGSLEASNINPVAELVNTIQGQRLYEALQKSISNQNDTLKKAVNEVGQVK